MSVEKLSTTRRNLLIGAGVGGLAGIAFAFMMGVVTYDNVWMAVAPPFVYWLINTAEGQFITPVAVGRRLKLNAVAVFLSLAFWAWLWSFVGMFLSTPMLIALRAFTERTDELSWLDTFLGGRSDCTDEDHAIVHDLMDEPTDACEPTQFGMTTGDGEGDEVTEADAGPEDDDDDRLAPAIS